MKALNKQIRDIRSDSDAIVIVAAVLTENAETNDGHESPKNGDEKALAEPLSSKRHTTLAEEIGSSSVARLTMAPPKAVECSHRYLADERVAVNVREQHADDGSQP